MASVAVYACIGIDMDMSVLQSLRILLHKKPVIGSPKTACILLAGGSGSRMGGDVPKQFLMLAGSPVLVHSLLAFQKCRIIDEIVLVAREEDLTYCEILCQEYKITKCKKVVAGGKERSESAFHGLEAVSPSMEYVAIHDAARCLITPKQIIKVAKAAYAYRAATAATPVVDSIKTVNRYGFIERNIPRETVWAMQTPQIFHKVYYRAAWEKAKQSHQILTDDNMLMELIGQRVMVIDTGCDNFKITVPTDIQRAEAVLEARKGKEQ